MRYISLFILTTFCILNCDNENRKIITEFLITSTDSNVVNDDYKVIDLGYKVKYDDHNVIQLSDKHSFGFTMEMNVHSSSYYHLRIKVKSKKYTVNLAAEPSWSSWTGSHFPIFTDNQKDWYYINLLIKTPDTIKDGKLKIYTYNWVSDTSYADSLQITEFNRFPFNDSLPDFAFSPLTYEILNELAFYTKNANETNYIDLLDEKILDKVFEKNAVSRNQYKKELKRRIKNASLAVVFSQIKLDAALFKNPSVKTSPRETFEHKLTGFTEKIVYTQGENITVQLQNASQLKSIQILKAIDNYKFQKINFITVKDKNSFRLATDSLSPGVYNIQLKDKSTVFNITVIMNCKTVSKLIVLAPITTWHAYNYYNGKCFYVNTKDDSCVYHISTQRPLVSCLFDSLLVGHDLFIFNNIYRFFYENYGCNVYPDYYLEAYPELFKNISTVVFAQHCEYFSSKMFNALAEFSLQKNIISLGGNQAYYKIQLSDDYKTIECRKDGTFLDNTLIPAGNWRTAYSDEAKYWGNAFTDAGYETYCPYKVKNASHWIYKNCVVKNEEEFGKYGIDNRGLSGDEMDKINFNSPQNTVLLAKGTNPDNGGGEITIIENKKNAILSFGSIACGSGLYKDKVFTQMIVNFMNKYHQK